MIHPRLGIACALVALSLGSLGCDTNTSGGGEGTDGSESGTAGEGGTAEGDTADDGSSGENACGAQDTLLTWAYDGVLVPPMELGEAGILGIDVARSGTDEQGTLTMTITTTCDGPLHLWALVWDSVGGPTNENADSLYISVDGGDEHIWLYGCRTEEGADQLWRWLSVESLISECDHEPVVFDVAAGEHTIVVRSREGGTGGIDVAAIGAVVVSHDPQTDPALLYPIPTE
jgi:hypothetical protein